MTNAYLPNWPRLALLLALLLPGSFRAVAQTPGVGIGTTAPNASAALDIVSTNKGLLLPRVADATAIASPATGLIVFQTGGTPGFYYNAGNATTSNWQQIATAAGAAITASNGLTKTGQNLTLGGQLTAPTTIAQAGNNLALTGGNVGIGTAAPAATLDVSGDFRVSTGTVNSTLGTTGSGNANFSGATGQSFTLPVDASIVSIRLACGATGFSTTFQVYAGAGPGGTTLLATPQAITFVANSSTTAVLATPLSVPAGVYTVFLNTGSNPLRYFNSGDNYPGGSVYSGSSAFVPLDLDFAVAYTSGSATSALVVHAGGNVGIGTTGAPGAKLDVTGGSIRISTAGQGLVFADGTTQTTAATTPAALTAGNGLTRTGNNVALGGTALGAATDVPLAGNNLTFSGSSGNVGIGTTTPSARLEANGDFKVSTGTASSGQVAQTYAPGSTSTGDPGQSFTLPTASSITSLGLYTSSAFGSTTLTIYQGAGIGGAVLATQAATVGAGTPALVTLTTPLALAAGQYTFIFTGNFGGIQSNSSNPYAGGTAYGGGSSLASVDFGFAVNYSSTTNTTLYAAPGGNVGIGTATPGAKLDVTGGSIKISTAGQGLVFPDGSTETTANRALSISGQNLTLGGTGGNTIILPTNTGATGPQGPQGPAGPTGATGATGPAGATGAQGVAGPAGATGAQGPIGNTGATGTTGAQGVAGPTGAAGTAGATGATGPAGPTGAGYSGSSTTLNTVITGSKTFTTQAGLAYVAGQRVRVANSATTYVEGPVTSYTTTSLVLNADRAVGSGTLTSWTIGVAGDQGATGATGATGTTGPAGSNATVTANNGLTVASGNVKLGGTALSAATDVPLAGNNLTFSGAGNVGIGTGTPADVLHLRATVGLRGRAETTGTSYAGWLSKNANAEFFAGVNGSGIDDYVVFDNLANAYRLVVKNGTGNVGIGTTAPTQTLDVAGTATVSGNVGLGTAPGTANRLLVANTQTTSVASDQQHSLQLEVRQGSGNKAMALGVLPNGAGMIQAKENGVGYYPLLLNPVNGNVGIGTSAPGQKLQVVAADNATVPIADFQAANLTQGVGLWYGGLRKTGSNADSDLALDGKGTGNMLLNTNGGTGNVGIGTTGPTALLDVNGSTRLRGLTTAGLVTTDASGNLSSVAQPATAATAAALTAVDKRQVAPADHPTQRVTAGFGTYANNSATTPFADFLHLRSYIDGSGGNDNLLVFNKSDLGMRLYQQAYGSTTAYGTYKDVLLADNGATAGYLPRYTNGGTTVSVGQSAVFQDGSGNVGIGTPSPAQRLDVTDGSIKISTAGQGLIFPDGSTQTTAATTAAATTASNGLTRTGNNVALGGTALVAATDVPLAGNNLTFSGASGNVGIGTSSPGSRLDVQAAPRSGTHGTGLPLYVTGNMLPAGNGAEFRHSNGSQGVGIGFNSIYATGSNANQDLNLMPRGTGGVGIGTTAPNAAAALDVSSTTKGLLPPRLTQAQRDAVGPASTAAGLLVYNTDTKALNSWDGTKWVEILGTAPGNGPTTTAFAYTGGPQTFVVPPGVTSITVTATGASGGAGGWGATVQTTLAVVPGEVLTVVVGGQGTYGASGPAAGGYNGGGSTGTIATYSGGGASDVRRAGTSTGDYLSSRNALVVAAGGGGNFATNGVSNGGNGGTPSPGATGGAGTGGYLPGGGATSSGPGAGGSGFNAGSNGTGGTSNPGGGGGGGYYGGGGAGSPGSASGFSGGGGGGSSFVTSSGSSATSYSQATGAGNGAVSITTGASLPSPTLSGANIVGVPGTWQVNGADVYRGSGKVGIGTSTPRGVLDVAGAGDVYLTPTPANSGTQALYLPGNILLAPYNGTSGISYIQARSSTAGANLGITLRATNAGTLFDALVLNANGTANFAGNVTSPGGFTNTSDRRFKQNIRPLGGALASVLALRGVRYEWNALGVQHGGTAGAGQVGLIAQELEKLYPELVVTDAAGYKSVNYAQLAPVLIEAIKELKAENEALRRQGSAQTLRLDQQQASLSTLQTQMARLLGEGTQARK